jgi:hypothetical protein
MDTRSALVARIAARFYAALVAIFGVFFLFFALVLAQTHAAESAWYPAIPAVLFMALSVFIWRGHARAMVLAIALSGVLVVMVIGEDPVYVWIASCATGIFVILSVLSLRGRARTVQR